MLNILPWTAYSFLHWKLSSIIFSVSSITSCRQIRKLSTQTSSCSSLSKSLESYLSVFAEPQDKNSIIKAFRSWDVSQCFYQSKQQSDSCDNSIHETIYSTIVISTIFIVNYVLEKLFWTLKPTKHTVTFLMSSSSHIAKYIDVS